MTDRSRLAYFAYDLPGEAIAQEPLAQRSASRLLDTTGPTIVHRQVLDLPTVVGPGDLIVINTTRVLPARLALTKATGGAVEVLLLEPAEDGADPATALVWRALVKPSRRVADGTILRPPTPDARHAGQPRFEVEVGAAIDGGQRLVTIGTDGPLLAALEAHGEVPLPPYIEQPILDPERYQTVFADRVASAAAPTAGLHLTDELLDQCRASGATIAPVELVVGLDTFRPVMVDDLDDHRMHTEFYDVPEATWEACQAATRVIAIGTTVVRALESAAARSQRRGRTDLFIRAPYEFQVVDVLLTNYHLPGSTLLVMIDAFAGPAWKDWYATALAEGYRFLSFGDAILLARA